MQVIYPPQELEKKHSFSLFLAGTIDLGVSIDWQQHVIEILKNYDVTIYNPRRPEWDNSIKQSIKDIKFREQVVWELDHLEKVDLIVMYLAADSKSPISLMELGRYADRHIVVYCADNFYRRGNVEIMCDRFKIPLFGDEKMFFDKLKASLSFYEKE